MLMTRRQWDPAKHTWKSENQNEFIDLDPTRQTYHFQTRGTPHINLLGGGPSGTFAGEVI